MESEKFRILKSVLGSNRRSNQEYLFYCPYCEHHKPKLSVNLEKNVYKCWVCDTKGRNLYHIIRKFGEYKHKQEWLQLESEIDYVDLEDFFTKAKKIEQIISLPNEYISLANSNLAATGFMARKYLKERGITKRDIIWWKMGYCPSGEYENRIIIPSFNENGEVNYFVSRSYDNSYPKYKNPPVNRDIVFNDLFIDWTTDVILVEGIFDAIVAGRNSVPLLGSTLRVDSGLFRKIVQKDASVYIALDPDAEKKALEIIKNFLTYDVELYKIDLYPYKDLGEMPREEFRTRKASAVRMNFDNLLQQSILA
jgi:DNA primase